MTNYSPTFRYFQLLLPLAKPICAIIWILSSPTTVTAPVPQWFPCQFWRLLTSSSGLLPGTTPFHSQRERQAVVGALGGSRRIRRSSIRQQFPVCGKYIENSNSNSIIFMHYISLYGELRFRQLSGVFLGLAWSLFVGSRHASQSTPKTKSNRMQKAKIEGFPHALHI